MYHRVYLCLLPVSHRISKHPLFRVFLPCTPVDGYTPPTPREPQYTCVAVWDDDKKRVAYCDVPGHNFGLKSAVVNFNRFPELAAVAARRLLWVVTEHYYDDNDTAEPECAGESGQSALVVLCGREFFGFPFDPAKHEDMRSSNEYLGVLSDIGDAHLGSLRVDVTKKRRNKIRELISEIRKTRKLRLCRMLAWRLRMWCA